ncbi:hypothetical protein, partial [Mesorhizobium sp.]|uniref:hypothetical protein n=1 Tax=Mesorhizobium sp. TaxID=1871066 RepID=UPI0025C14D6B
TNTGCTGLTDERTTIHAFSSRLEPTDRYSDIRGALIGCAKQYTGKMSSPAPRATCNYSLTPTVLAHSENRNLPWQSAD